MKLRNILRFDRDFTEEELFRLALFYPKAISKLNDIIHLTGLYKSTNSYFIEDFMFTVSDCYFIPIVGTNANENVFITDIEHLYDAAYSVRFHKGNHQVVSPEIILENF